MDFKFLSGMLLPQNTLMGAVVFTKVLGLAKSQSQRSRDPTQDGCIKEFIKRK